MKQLSLVDLQYLIFVVVILINFISSNCELP